MKFKLSRRSRRALHNVHSDLVLVVGRAIYVTEIDFVVLEGRRSLARQAELVRTGASKTMNSRHLTGHAVDIGAWVDGDIRWDWPLYNRLATTFKRVAQELNIPVEWGGDWVSFKDGPHYQLPWREYGV